MSFSLGPNLFPRAFPLKVAFRGKALGTRRLPWAKLPRKK